MPGVTEMQSNLPLLMSCVPSSVLVPGGLWGCPNSHWYNKHDRKRFPG